MIPMSPVNRRSRAVACLVVRPESGRLLIHYDFICIIYSRLVIPNERLYHLYDDLYKFDNMLLRTFVEACSSGAKSNLGSGGHLVTTMHRHVTRSAYGIVSPPDHHRKILEGKS